MPYLFLVLKNLLLLLLIADPSACLLSAGIRGVYHHRLHCYFMFPVLLLCLLESCPYSSCCALVGAFRMAQVACNSELWGDEELLSSSTGPEGPTVTLPLKGWSPYSGPYLLVGLLGTYGGQ